MPYRPNISYEHLVSFCEAVMFMVFIGKNLLAWNFGLGSANEFWSTVTREGTKEDMQIRKAREDELSGAKYYSL